MTKKHDKNNYNHHGHKRGETMVDYKRKQIQRVESIKRKIIAIMLKCSISLWLKTVGRNNS